MGDPSTNMLIPNFGFAFNDKNFSDRVLHIEMALADSLPKNEFVNSTHEVESFHVNSLILAEKSPFFYKLFQNGMLESQNKEATLKIISSEKTSLMNLLNFMYSNSLSSTTSSDILDVLMIADKFEVTSCMKYCVDLLMKMPMSLEHAISSLELPSTVRAAQVVQPLIDASKQYLVTHYSDFNNLHKEATKLPLCAIEVILESDDLQVISEDFVYDFALRWARTHYPKLEERREIITNGLMQCIRFPYMSSSKLKEVLKCPDFDHEEVNKLVMDALFFKVETPNGLTSIECGFSGRAYKNLPVKVLQLDFPCPRCVVFFDLKKKECADLFPSKFLYTQSFLLGGKRFYLAARCKREPLQSVEHFGLFVHSVIGSEACTLDVELKVITKASLNRFKSYYKDSSVVLTDKLGLGSLDHFGVPWSTFMSDESEYFIDGILHIRVELTIINSKA